MNAETKTARNFSVAEIRLDRDKRKRLRDLQKQRRSLDTRTEADKISRIDEEISALLETGREG